MAQEQDGGQEPAPETLDETHRHGDELSTSIFGPSVSNEVETLATVLVAFVAKALIAAAKTVAALITGSASLVAEAAHSWADTGNEIFLWSPTGAPAVRPTAPIHSVTAARPTSRGAPGDRFHDS